MSGVIIHLLCEAPCYQFCSIWLNVTREETPIYLRIHPDNPESSFFIDKHQWAHSIWSHTSPCHNTVCSLFDTWCSCFGSSALPVLLKMFLFQKFWYKFIPVSSVEESGSRALGLFYMLSGWDSSGLLFLNVISGLHFFVNRSYLRSWRRLLIVDWYTCTFSSPRKGFCDHLH